MSRGCSRTSDLDTTTSTEVTVRSSDMRTPVKLINGNLDFDSNTYVNVPNKAKSTFLSLLVESHNYNINFKRQGFRYDEILKLIAAYIYIVGGRIIYETLAKNLFLPPITTPERIISSHSQSLFECIMRCKDLKEFLKTRNLPLVVWLSVDATSLTGIIQYDQNTNQIVGFVVPLDKQGTPIPFSFPVTSACVIEKYFQDEKVASSLYTIIAQPLQNDAPYFCLCFYGTDNKFTAEHVLGRWDCTVHELKKYGKTVAGISSDGDSRILKVMRIKSLNMYQEAKELQLT